jgi:hypothetical protein
MRSKHAMPLGNGGGGYPALWKKKCRWIRWSASNG